MKILGILGKNIEDSYVFNIKYLKKFSNINCIGIFDNSDYTICDAFFIQGGTKIESWYYDIIDYAIKNNKPILGICLGCQILGLYGDENAKLNFVNEHYNTYHKINIKKGNFLYDLYGSNVLVNSRHKECIYKLSSLFEVIAIADDGVIEAIRYKSSINFVVGIQFHPEEIDNMNIIFDTFIKYIVK